MGESDAGPGRAVRRVLAALAVTDLAYRLLVRPQVRRALGIEPGHA